MLADFGRSSKVKLSPRIYGGENAQIVDFPWQLSLRYGNWHVCGASILSVRRALTATHCYDRRNTYTVTAGSANKNHFLLRNNNVIKFITHPDYNETTLFADIAVLWLKHDLVFNSRVHPVRLPEQDEVFESGTKVLVSGWGRTEHGNASRKLKWIELYVVGDEQCNATYSIHPDMLCAGYANDERDTMVGDSGGALVMGNVQIGIVSWGDFIKNQHLPGVYTRVANYINWIKRVTKISITKTTKISSNSSFKISGKTHE